MTVPILKVTNMHAGFGKAEVLHGISLEVMPGGVITVIGPNGAGKSTTLNALMGLLKASGGIEFNGQAIDDTTLEERVMLGIALVPERRELFTTMSVADNLLLGGYRPMKLGDRQWRDGLDQVYSLFPRLKERERQMAGTLSGGERQMLAVARALMGQPKLLMLDEPSLGLAPRVVKEIFNIIERLRESGVSILLVEQNARAALAVAGHAYVLETGDVSLQGPAGELAKDPRVIETYLGSGKSKAAASSQ
jgi:branched-chain amino acid transport system ATP-binding protein